MEKAFKGRETTAVCNLVKQMIKRGATAEELLKVTDYLEAAVSFDISNLRLNDIAQQTGIKELTKKYGWNNPDVEATKAAINRLYGAPNQTTEIHIADIKSGDQLIIPLEEFGTFTATAQIVNKHGAMFIFDECVVKKPMNAEDTNCGGFEKSDLKRWMDTKLFESFPDWIKPKIHYLTIPTFGEIIGWDADQNKKFIEGDINRQLPLMKEYENRIAYWKNDLIPMRYWLRNAMKKNFSSVHFAIMGSYGGAACDPASTSNGVRPSFWLSE